MNIFIPNFHSDKYIIATYYLASQTNIRNAAWELAIGQSLGNPKVRSKWETEELFKNHSCIIMENELELSKHQSGYVKIAFPLANMDLSTDGVSQLLCHLMGGQMDIDDIVACHLINIEFPNNPEITKNFLGPKFGIDGIRKFTGVHDKPLLGGIVKPKITTSPELLLEMVTEMVEGGVNFIKEDELMSNPSVCPLEDRVKVISKYLQGKNVVYAYCINADSPYLLDRVKMVHDLGGNGIHVNFWSGLGAYKAIRELDLPLFVHFQKSGDKVLTNKTHAYHIDWNVICDLAGLMGVDFIHAGMWGGYMSDSAIDLQSTLAVLRHRGVMPALSCGMHPGLVAAISKQFGHDYMANVGGALHGHPRGTLGGTRAMRQAIDGVYGEEYNEAIKKWGLVE
jgi:ribulose-bisphosphate carboxylase large chain